MSKHFASQVVLNIEIAPNTYQITLKPLTEGLTLPKPGQFYMLETAKGTDPLLKRPFSVFDYNDGTLSFLYRLRGKGTKMLATLQSAACINVLGPLGTYYPKPQGDFIVVAGGIGIASVYALIKEHPLQAVLFYGARLKSELILLDELKPLLKALYISTDDGSLGIKGTAVDALKAYLKRDMKLPIYACGPKAMLKAVADITRQNALKAFVSMEEHMACGMGACLGCVCKGLENSKATLLRVCTEGPVFDSEVLIWD